jgi:short-subunit dehydrogenase
MNKRIILTGAAGGIGQPLALALAAQGARLALVEYSQQKLDEICQKIADLNGFAVPIVADLSNTAEVKTIVKRAYPAIGGVDMLINNAGIMDFTYFERQATERIEQMITTNVTSPMLLARAVLPHFLAQGSGRIVNIGSAFGAIGFPHHATYCASKFALRGFSEALRRELLDSGVGVTYIAPRATRTALNNNATNQMLAATSANMDNPEDVADLIVKAIVQERKEYSIGTPESFFARLNGILPRLVDLGMQKQTRISRQFI